MPAWYSQFCKWSSGALDRTFAAYGEQCWFGEIDPIRGLTNGH